MDFHGLHFFKPYERLLDLSKGPEWAEWCVGGTPNSVRMEAECSPIAGTGPSATDPSPCRTGGAAIVATPFGVPTCIRLRAGCRASRKIIDEAERDVAC